MSAPQTQVSAQANGSISINGQPFFPFGFYHISWADHGTPSQRLSDIKTMARAGFNVVFTEPIRDTNQEMLPLLQLARNEKMFVFAHGVQPTSVKLLAQQPSLLGFTLMDDSNYNSTPDAVAQLQAAYKAMAPDKLTSITLALASDRPESDFFGVSDAVSNMSYPIGGTDEIRVVYSVMRQTVQEAQRRGVVPIASLQTFAWPQKRWPTAEELRNMTYQAVMAGVKGVAYYSYRSDGNDITAHPALWSATQAMALQIRQLAPILLTGERREISTSEDSQILAVQFSGSSNSYLLALNTSAQPQPLRFNVPNARRLWPLFGSSPLKFQKGQLSGTLGALGVQVFKVE